MQVKGTEIFVKALKEEGVDILFGYPGGQAIDLFDALFDQDEIEVIMPRHEQALVHAADGYARSTGKVGVCLVTSGPGATNLVTGIATANYDSVPLVCFTGQVPQSLLGNDAFQEVDIVGITRSICKYAVTVRDRKELPRIIKEAFYIARTGRPGPVVVDLPKDVQQAMGSDEYPSEVNIRSYKPNEGVHMGQIKRAVTILNKAKKPLFLIGGGVNISHANKEMTKLVDITGVPIITTIMGKGAVSTNHPLYMGNIGIHGSYAANHAVSECDVLFSIGTRFNDRITGKISEFAKNATIIHIDIDSASISKNIAVDIPIVADAKLAIEKLIELAVPVKTDEWIDEVSGWKKKYPINMDKNSGMTPEKIIRTINDMYKNLIVVTDVGQNQLWTTQYIELDENKQLLTSGGLGTMGYGFPAAIGAKLGNPDKDVICITGDGGMQMNIQEMATAVAMELPVIICIFNNGYLGNVRQWQEMFYNKRYSSTCLRYRKSCNRDCGNCDKECPKYTPDFIKLAESYDAYGIRVTKEEEIVNAFLYANSHKDGPTIIEFIIEREVNVLPMVPGGKPLNEMIMDC
ncbi:biosynthetic-type acetolactate synthase large subunit [[Clostridium] fimetarium]|uniref:Acetolactate synthase n=1 Tax=[Clostridium] fimetarium TaxID=99656 RepID=A0A1I0QCQ2_9FIRM|nr:biosynthetic-type acetolactate synthase large subunit [[Clostridium] fimetarium]SEW24822.1 acetolactate synthase, large subunit [[Clostridium] fimetarium]